MANVQQLLGAAPRPSRRKWRRSRSPVWFSAIWFGTLTEMMLKYLIPMVEKTYRVSPGRENRAMAGLSTGGMQSFMTMLSYVDKCAYLGGFGGSSGGRSGFDAKTAHGGVFANPDAFSRKMNALFVAIGTAEGQRNKSISDPLTKARIKNIYFEFGGTAHERLT